ncbi:unnamed protein product, partial [Polarella glacialis]
MPCQRFKAAGLVGTAWLLSARSGPRPASAGQPTVPLAASEDAEVARLCWQHRGGVVAAEACCRRVGPQKEDWPCVQSSEPSHILELCCAHFSTLAGSAEEAQLPGCDAPLLEVIHVQLEMLKGVPRASQASGIQAMPLRLFGDFIKAVLQLYLGGALDGEARFAWRAIAHSEDASQRFCPLSSVLSKLLRVELALALRQDVFAEAAAAVKASLDLEASLGGASLRALLAAGRQRLSLWQDHSDQLYFSRGASAFLNGSEQVHSEAGLQELQRWLLHQEGPGASLGQGPAEPDPWREVEDEWLQRIAWRKGPNPLCWTEERSKRGATHEACCRRASVPSSCWDSTFDSDACCPSSSSWSSAPSGSSGRENRCGDLVVGVAKLDTRSEFITLDPLREFHVNAMRHLNADTEAGAEVGTDDGSTTSMTWALISMWPDTDLRKRCPEVWLLSRLLEAEVPELQSPGHPTLGRPTVQELRDFYLSQSPGALTKLPSQLMGDLGVNLGAPRPTQGDALTTAQPVDLAAAWRSALQDCSRQVCSENTIDENSKSGALCGGIPIRSENGGAGRTSEFGRLLWCAAQLSSEGAVLDVYAGSGDTAALITDGLKRRSGRSSAKPSLGAGEEILRLGALLISFELSQGKASTVAARLRSQGAAVQEVKLGVPNLQDGSAVLAALQSGAVQAWKLQGAFGLPSAAIIVVGRTSESSSGNSVKGKMSSSALAQATSLIKDFALVLLDPDMEMPPEDFARDWKTIEASRPRLVAIYNTNLPGGAGWVRNRLLALGSYVEVVSGHNDGGEGEPEELLQIRAWCLLMRVAEASGPMGESRGSVVHRASAAMSAEVAAANLSSKDGPGVRMVGKQAEEWIQSAMQQGAEWGKTTNRGIMGGVVLKVHNEIEGLVPVEIQRPSSDLLSPPRPETNPFTCLADTDPIVSARDVRVPCFLTCEGPHFDPRWAKFRQKLVQNAADGFPISEELFMDAVTLTKDIVNDDAALIKGRSRFMARLRHEFHSDGHLEGFCMYGITSAQFVKARHWLDMEPQLMEHKGRKVFAPRVALDDFDMAYTLLSDSNSKFGIEFSFLENSAWPVKLEDIILNLEAQKAKLGSPFQQISLMAYDADWGQGGGQPVGCQGEKSASARTLDISSKAPFRICGVGDHLTATFDAMLMAEESLASTGAWKRSFGREVLGRFCPRHRGQGHQCRQRCELLGAGCGSKTSSEDDDPIAQWLEGVIDAETLEELPFDVEERRQSLAKVVAQDPRLAQADLIVCSHPTLLCIMLAEVSDRPVFTHASSTLLYGLPCINCQAGKDSNLRLYGRTEPGLSYLRAVRKLLLQSNTDADGPDRSRLAFIAEGRFLAEQIRWQVGVEVPWAPPLALYAERGQWKGSEGLQSANWLRRAVILRSRYFTSLMGELLRSLLRELISLNAPALPLE